MSNTKKRKSEQLGMDAGTAAHQLRKAVMFSLLQQLGQDICFRCSGKIENVQSLSIEHKKAWLDSDNPKELFFDLSNIAFSHLSCNVVHRRIPNQKYFTPEERTEATRAIWRKSQRKSMTPEKRREKYLTKGY